MATRTRAPDPHQIPLFKTAKRRRKSVLESPPPSSPDQQPPIPPVKSKAKKKRRRKLPKPQPKISSEVQFLLFGAERPERTRHGVRRREAYIHLTREDRIAQAKADLEAGVKFRRQRESTTRILRVDELTLVPAVPGRGSRYIAPGVYASNLDLPPDFHLRRLAIQQTWDDRTRLEKRNCYISPPVSFDPAGTSLDAPTDTNRIADED